MAQEYTKRFVTKDGNKRVSIYREGNPCNPRNNTDEPFHCCDWSRDYSIKVKGDPSYSDARSLLNQMLVWYGKREVIIDMLVENGKHMTDGKSVCNNALVYNKSMRRWELKEYTKWYGEKEYEWKDAEWFDGRKDDIDLGTLVESCLDSTIDELQYFKYWTDGIKMMSYSFGYYGEVSFHDEVFCDSEGICWLEKNEFLKYSGCKEEYWQSKSLTDIEWLISELKAWGNGDVYGFVAEEKVLSKIHKEYTNVERDDEDYEEEEWEETDSCWGFYGELDDEHIGNILSSAGYKKEELIEVA